MVFPIRTEIYVVFLQNKPNNLVRLNTAIIFDITIYFEEG